MGPHDDSGVHMQELKVRALGLELLTFMCAVDEDLEGALVVPRVVIRRGRGELLIGRHQG